MKVSAKRVKERRRKHYINQKRRRTRELHREIQHLKDMLVLRAASESRLRAKIAVLSKTISALTETLASK